MLDIKPPLQSLTINAGLLGLIVQLLTIFGIQMAPETVQAIVSTVSSIVSGVLFLIAIYGRWRATRLIVKATPPLG